MFWLLLVLTGFSLLLYFRLLNWFPPPLLSLAILLFTLGSFPVGLGLRLRQLSLLSGFLLAAALVLIVCKRYSVAGVLLALATIKPQLTFLVVAWLLLWSVSEWRSRRRFVWSFAGSMAVLLAASELFLHNWIPQFLESTVSYLHYTDGRSILQLLFTRRGGAVLGILLVVAVLIYCARYRHADPRTPAFALCASIVFAATLVVIPTIAPHGQILLIPGLLFVLQRKSAIWRGGRVCRMSLVATLLLLMWQWLSAFGLALFAIVSGVAAVRRLWVVPLSTSLLLPLAVGATLLIAAAQCVAPEAASKMQGTSSSAPRL